MHKYASPALTPAIVPAFQCFLKHPPDKETKKAKCECTFNGKDLIISELINQTDKFSFTFTNQGETSNVIAMKCVYTLFSKSGLLKNICSYILLFTILLFLISAILFHKCGYNLLEDDIQEIIEKKEKNEHDNLNVQNTIDTNDKKEKNLIISKTKKSKYKKKIKKKRKQISKDIEIKSYLSSDPKYISIKFNMCK